MQRSRTITQAASLDLDQPVPQLVMIDEPTQISKKSTLDKCFYGADFFFHKVIMNLSLFFLVEPPEPKKVRRQPSQAAIRAASLSGEYASGIKLSGPLTENSKKTIHH